MKFKVGDTVRIIDNITKHGFGVGDVVEIAEVFDNYYRVEDTESYDYITDDEIETLEGLKC